MGEGAFIILPFLKMVATTSKIIGSEVLKCLNIFLRIPFPFEDGIVFFPVRVVFINDFRGHRELYF